ncbi:MAG: hypothetical protein GX430_14480 [Treponema sp.]|nr:hypothetical protein [Treponema sp.]
MKRIVLVLTAAAFCARLPGLYAQGFSEPDEQSVLQKARDKYGRAEEPSAPSNAPDRSNAEESGLPYSPFVLSFVPGIQFPPFGLYDTSAAFGWIGSGVGNVEGIQASGVFNLSRNVEGFQGAGVFNISRDVEGFQGAGVFNIARDVDGFQGAGVFNIARKVEGFQAAGTFNIADTVDGGMISGVFNAAKRVSGPMIGLVNVADRLDGVALGLVNIIGNGVNEIGLSYIPSEDMTYLSYRTGTASLYAVYYGGLGSEDWFMDADSLIAGLGLGHRIRVGEGGLDVEVSAEQELYADRRAALSAAAEAEDERAFWNLLRPYPSVRAALNIPVLGIKAVLGIEADFDVPSWGSYVPDRLKTSSFSPGGWSGELWGLEFTAWPKVYFGLSF